MKTLKTIGLLAITLFTALTARPQGHMISQFPNAPTPGSNYLFLLERPGVSNYNISYGQLLYNITNGLLTGGSGATFDAAQFGSSAGGTNIKSGAVLTNVVLKGATLSTVTTNSAVGPTKLIGTDTLSREVGATISGATWNGSTLIIPPASQTPWTTPIDGNGQTLTNVISIYVKGPGTNNWLRVTNGSIVIPPFAQPGEEVGADGISGGIYFAGPTETDGPLSGPRYILNLAHRGHPEAMGELLISHYNIALEPQGMGSLILGNDGTAGNKIAIIQDDAFGANLVANQEGHSHVVLFSARIKDSFGNLWNSYPGIVAFSGTATNHSVPSDIQGSYGQHNEGRLAFYTAIPFPQVDSSLFGGILSATMETNGWTWVGSVNASNGFRVGTAIGMTTNINAIIAGASNTTNQLQFTKGILTGVVPQ